MVFILGLICLSPAIAYPTPGTQLSLATAFSWMPIAMFLNKSLQANSANIAVSSVRTVWLGTLSITLLASDPWYRWALNEPLIGRGVSLMRLEASVANRENAITRAIVDSNADYLVFDGHNHNRFLFRTGLQPLTAANPTFWPRMLSGKEQSNLIKRISSCKSLCVVIPPDSDALAGDEAARVRSLVHFGLQQRESIGDWRIGTRQTDLWRFLSRQKMFGRR